MELYAHIYKSKLGNLYLLQSTRLEGADKIVFYWTGCMVYELMQQIEKSLNDIILVHGQIKKVSKIGNSMTIWFTDGNVYKQPLVSKQTDIVVLD